MAGVLMFLFIAVFLVILGRFMYIQASGSVHGVSLEEWAKEKRNSTYYLESERGRILDTNGMVLAYDRATFRLYAIVDETYSATAKEPLHVTDPKKTAQALAPILEEDESFILERLERGIAEGRFQVEFGKAGRHLSQSVRDEIDALDLPGINFIKEPIRHYPNGVFASHIIGFARQQEDSEQNTHEIVGVTGIEREMNELLQGEDGYVSYQRDFYNKKLLDPDEVVKKPIDGHDVYLTIDQKVQTLLEDVMTDVELAYQPERITAIVLNAKTGEVIAMSNRPSYDPNNPEDVQNWYNDVISTPFEPGSTVKMFTWAAAIDAGVYNGNETFKSGTYVANERIEPIHDHNRGRGWGAITFDEGFQRSSNVAASKLVWEKMGPDVFLEYLKKFHFDQKTNIDLPGEVPGQILYNWPSEKLRTAFGQGSTVTPIQQVKAATAIANEGKMLQPYVIKKIVHPDTGEVIVENTPTVVSEPINKETASKVLELLDSVVNGKNGTGRIYQLEDYSVIGKTGTAEIPNPHGAGYLSGHGNNIYSFLGMAPKDDPELIMYVAVNQPKLSYQESGSMTVAHIFNNVMENSLHYLNIEPDQAEVEPIKPVTIPALIGEDTKQVKETLQQIDIKVTLIGDGEKIVAASAHEGANMLPNDHLILLTDEPKMPNIKGWSLREVIKLADLLDLQLEFLGSGYVTQQSIQVDTPLKQGDYLGIELSAPSLLENDQEENDTDHSTNEDELEADE